jgi:hypothetical protein
LSILTLAATSVQDMPLGHPAPGGTPPPAPVVIAAPGLAGPAAASPAQQANVVTNAIASLTSFIPAETLTFFVAIAGIIQGWKTPTEDEHGYFLAAFILFLVLSPAFYIVAAIATAKSTGKTFVVSGKFVWRMAALLIAFVVWSCAISNDTFAALLGLLGFAPTLPHLRDILSIAVLLTSALLSSIDNLF